MPKEWTDGEVSVTMDLNKLDLPSLDSLPYWLKEVVVDAAADAVCAPDLITRGEGLTKFQHDMERFYQKHPTLLGFHATCRPKREEEYFKRRCYERATMLMMMAQREAANIDARRSKK